MQNFKQSNYTKLQQSNNIKKKTDAIPKPKGQVTISKFFASKNENADVFSTKTDPKVLEESLNLCDQKRKVINPSVKKRQRNDHEASSSKRLCSDSLSSIQRNLENGGENNASILVGVEDHTPKKLSASTKLKLKAYALDQSSEHSVDFETIKKKCGKHQLIIEDDQSVSQHILEDDPNDEMEERDSVPKDDSSTSKLAKYSSSQGVQINKKTKSKYTPLEQQFIELKEKHCDALLFVECGYKYRFFGEDAEIASKVLKIYCRMDHNFMTASIPTHRLFVHVRRLVAAGYKVGVVKQTETAALKAAGDNKTAPFTRCLSALYTKSTLIGEDVDPLSGVEVEDCTSSSGPDATLMCVWDVPTGKNSKQHDISIVAVQPATGEVVYDSFGDSATRSELETRISHLQPVEILISDSVDNKTEQLVMDFSSLSSIGEDRIRVEKISSQLFDYTEAFQLVSAFYSTESTDSSLLQEIVSLPKPVISCLAATISYLREFKLETAMKNTGTLNHFCMRNSYMYLNGNAVRQLELFTNQTDRTQRGSLFQTFNHTVSKFGARMLKTWMRRPLLDISFIKRRQAAVTELITSPSAALKKLKDSLSKSPDLEKGLCSIYHKKCSSSEFYAVCKTFHSLITELKSSKAELTQALTSELLMEIITDVPDLLETSQRFYDAIQEKAARNGDKTELFKETSMFPRVQEIRQDITAVRDEIQKHKREVRLQLRQPSLDYVTVSNTEFLIEVKNKDLKLVPTNWAKISSTKAVSRFHTPFIEEKYKTLNQLQENLTIQCHEAWQQFLGWFGENYHQYRRGIQHLATLDCLFSMAAIAQRHSYCRPEITAETGVEIKAGRHPIIDKLLCEQDQFVPNDTSMHPNKNRLMVITGPNMGGKSSYIKQVALITILAQMGSYVPAEAARIGVVDSVFTRLGAADDICRGRSTFMVELQEVSEIMDQATDRSLVILDELGRGTSTHDGVAIAYATLQYFIMETKCLTLFVTHYPLLSEFEQIYPGLVQNYHMSFMIHDEEDGKDDRTKALTFLYQLVSGMADRSYGLNVARLASIPSELIVNASFHARKLEDKVQLHRQTLEDFGLLYNCDENTILTHLTSTQESPMEV